MRNIISFLLFAIVAVSCEKITGEGPILTNDYELSTSIEEIHVGSALRLELNDEIGVGKVKIETYSNLFEYVNFETNGSGLSLYMDNERYKGDITVVVYASSRQYSSVCASGASSVSLEDVPPFSSYKISLSGASKFSASKDFDAISLLSLYASGSSTALISGSADRCVVDASGSSSVYGADLICHDLDLQLSGASVLKIKIDNTANGGMSGSSKLYYSGTPQFNVSTSGSSSMRPL